ncbi:MAG: class III extradiol ring-cleavage dioxygenase, partial [Wenzhouxiangellaceae bacterium]
MEKRPSLFVSHGAPTFALEPGAIGEKLKRLGRQLLPLEAVVVISAHWLTDTIRVTASARPETIHDFRGFDPALFDIRYPAPGNPELAGQIVERLRQAGWSADVDDHHGLDHGAWVPLLHLLPDAQVPVIQVSLPSDLNGEGAWRLGRALAPLSDAGVLVVGSGSLTHNLYEVFRGAEDTA